MNIPEELEEAINKEVEASRFSSLVEAREELTNRYRCQNKREFMTKQGHREAYLLARMPATYAVIYRVLEELKERDPKATIQSLMDLGAGPGTGLWAASMLFPELRVATLIEKDGELLQLGKRLVLQSNNQLLRKTQWVQEDLEKASAFTPHDLTLFSYSIGELLPSSILSLLEICWRTTKYLIVIEPGTPTGFERLRTIREQLITLGAHLIAPCPHSQTCPMQGDDWCHFSKRVERSSLHRRIKGGSLGYEDEKYSYLIFSKDPAPLPYGRILRDPIKRSGHVVLTLCADGAMKKEVVSKKSNNYKVVRKLDWGDILEKEKKNDSTVHRS